MLNGQGFRSWGDGIGRARSRVCLLQVSCFLHWSAHRIKARLEKRVLEERAKIEMVDLVGGEKHVLTSLRTQNANSLETLRPPGKPSLKFPCSARAVSLRQHLLTRCPYEVPPMTD